MTHTASSRVVLGLLLLLALCGGCASVSNPTWDAVPVRRLPPEAFAESKEAMRPVALTLLRQKPQSPYRLDSGDILGIWIEGVLGERNQPMPVRFSEQGNVPPSFGYPIPVREDGTIPLPLVDPLNVKGMSVSEAQQALIRVYTGVGPGSKRILKPGQERVIVTLVRPRHYHVLVVREDSGTSTAGTAGGFGGGGLGSSSGTFLSETFRSTGHPLDLPAGENDVLNALAKSGGLPGFEAEPEVIVERGGYPEANDRSANWANRRPFDASKLAHGSGEIVRIPMRVRPGEQVNLRPDDVILKNGDIVYVRARLGEVFYTGGLLPPRMFPLPKGRDLDVVEAMALVGAPFLNGGFNSNNLNGNVINGGLGNPSPSQITIVRRMRCGGQIPIKVNLNRALRDPRERILIQAGDVVLMQETLEESFTRYINTNLRFDFFATIIRQRDLTGTANLVAP